jgi:hypothetical protein
MGDYDIVLKGSRLVDPANGVDDLRDLAIKDGKIAAVEENIDPDKAKSLIDLRGKIIVPGIIDPHAHFINPELGPRAYRMMVRAGVVTGVDMGGGPQEGQMKDVYSSLDANGAGMNLAVLANIRAYLPSLMEQNPSRSELQKSAKVAVESGAIGVKILGQLTPEATKTAIEIANEMRIHVTHHCGTSANANQPSVKALKNAVEMVGKDLRLHIAHIQHYCRGESKDPMAEALDALTMLEGKDNIVSDSLLSPYNSCSGECSNGQVKDAQTKMCLKLRGYPTNEEGLKQSILDGYGLVQYLVGESDTLLLRRLEALKHWRDKNTNVRMCFPVNAPEAEIPLTTRKDHKGEFIVDAISTDGGVTPKNVQVKSGLALFQLGALTLEEFALKTSYNASRIFGMMNKGHLGVGADADITVLDLSRGEAVMSLALGKLIMIDGIVVGRGGTVITTERGERRVKASGLPYELIDLEKSRLYG